MRINVVSFLAVATLAFLVAVAPCFNVRTPSSVVTSRTKATDKQIDGAREKPLSPVIPEAPPTLDLSTLTAETKSGRFPQNGQVSQNLQSLNLRRAPINPSAPLILTLSSGNRIAATSTVIPTIEIEREHEEAADDKRANLGENPLRIATGLECTSAVRATVLSKSHVVVDVPNRRYLFCVSGLLNKTVRIDISRNLGAEGEGQQNESGTPPVYCYVDSGYVTAAAFTPQISNNQSNDHKLTGASDPSAWTPVPNTWQSSPRVTSFVVHFKKDSAMFSMRIPRTPSYNDEFLTSLKANPHISVVRVGHSREGRSLSAACITQSGNISEQKKCVLIYAGEHADEPEGMWAAEGALQFAASEDSVAVALRSNYTVIVIPTLDPDASASGVHEGITGAFLRERTTTETDFYADWIESLIESGHKIDICIDLHNGGFAVPGNLACALLERSGGRGELSLQIHRSIIRSVTSDGFIANERPWQRGWSPDRFGGWLTRRFGTLTLAYEIDGSCTVRRLSLKEMKTVGGGLIRGIESVLCKPSISSRLSEETDSMLARRANGVKDFRRRDAQEHAIAYEAALGIAEGSDVPFTGEQLIP